MYCRRGSVDLGRFTVIWVTPNYASRGWDNPVRSCCIS